MEAAVAEPQVPPHTHVGPPAGGPTTKAAWAEAAAFSAAKEGKSSGDETAEASTAKDSSANAPALSTDSAEKGAAGPALTAERLIEVLRALGKPADLDAIRSEINTNADLANHVPGGVVATALKALVEAKTALVSVEGTPAHDHFALAEASTEKVMAAPPPEPTAEAKIRTELVNARAAVVAAIAAGLVYGVGGHHEPPRPPAGGGVDLFQISYLIHVSAESPAGATPVPIFHDGVAVLTRELTSLDVSGLENRVSAHLTALGEAGVVTSWDVKSIKAPPEGEAEGETAPRILYALTAEGRIRYQARGALGVAESTIPALPSGPTVEEQMAAAIAPMKTLLQERTMEANNAIAQRDTALHQHARAQELLSKYRGWFVRHEIAEPDAVVDARRPTDKKIIKEYAIEVVFDEAQHWRLIEEKRLAKIKQAELTAAADTSKETWKGKLKEAEALVASLDALTEYKPGTRHVLTKDVYKEMGPKGVHVFSADPHDYGNLIVVEPIHPGSQRTIPATNVPEVPADPPKPTAVPAAVVVGAVATSSAAASSSVEAPSTSMPAIDPASDAGRVLTLLRTKGAAPDKKLAKALKLELPKVVAALGALGARVEKNGTEWAAVKEPAVPVVDDKPKADGTQDLTTAAVRAGLTTMLTAGPLSKTGCYRTNIGAEYLRLMKIPAGDGAKKKVDLVVDAMVTDGTLSQGEGGHDALLWHGTLPDPRLSDADKAPAAAPHTSPSILKPGGDHGADKGGATTPARAPAKGAAKAAAPKEKKTAPKGRGGKARA